MQLNTVPNSDLCRSSILNFTSHLPRLLTQPELHAKIIKIPLHNLCMLLGEVDIQTVSLKDWENFLDEILKIEDVLYITVESVLLLSKALRPFPDLKWLFITNWLRYQHNATSEIFDAVVNEPVGEAHIFDLFIIAVCLFLTQSYHVLLLIPVAQNQRL